MGTTCTLMVDPCQCKAKPLQYCKVSVQPHRRQLTRLLHPWDSPGKNTGIGCHFLLQCMEVKIESEGTHSCSTLHDHMDGSLPGSSVHGIFQARVLEWGAIAYIYICINTYTHIYIQMYTYTPSSSQSPGKLDVTGLLSGETEVLGGRITCSRTHS